MTSPSSPSNSLASIENLMKAGQHSMRQFDDAITMAMGVGGGGRTTGQGMWPFSVYPNYVTEAWRLWNAGIINALTVGTMSNIQPSRGDKRFKDDAWQQSPYYDLLKQSYLLTSKQLSDLVYQSQVDDKSKLQLRFYARQFIDAMSSSNFPATNPEVIRTAIQTRSASLAAGMQNLIEDIQKGRITRVDETAFEVGRNLAATPGSVVFENELIQLIEYAPQTSDVEKTPLLIVPPCINKLEGAAERPGSWWPDWDAWMKRRSSGTVRAPAQPGNANFLAIEPAPGRYVKQKSN